jgi:hypothetical protein
MNSFDGRTRCGLRLPMALAPAKIEDRQGRVALNLCAAALAAKGTGVDYLPHMARISVENMAAAEVVFNGR